MQYVLGVVPDDVRYFPKGFYFQATTSQMFNFPSSNFPSLSQPQHSVPLQPAASQKAFGKLMLGKLYIWEVPTWEMVTWEITLGKMPFGKVPNTFLAYTLKRICVHQQVIKYTRWQQRNGQIIQEVSSVKYKFSHNYS